MVVVMRLKRGKEGDEEREKGLMGGREKESFWLKEGTKTTQHNTFS